MRQEIGENTAAKILLIACASGVNACYPEQSEGSGLFCWRIPLRNAAKK
jgi:hypothetical protein